MIVSPKFRGFICTTAHPTGCELNVQEQINYVKKQGSVNGGKKVLVIGASTGYGLASRIVSTFGCGASTIGVFFERPAEESKTGSAGWYNSAAFEEFATKEGYYAKSINGDAFSNDIKEKTINLIKKDLGQIDLIVYSLASPRRTHPITGETLSSVIKPVGTLYTNKTVDFHTGEISMTAIEPATDDEIRQTIGVMGGEDWEMWIKALNDAGVIAKGATTVAYSYVGPKITYAVYHEGTIGRAKDHLEATAKSINTYLAEKLNGRAFVSVNKALVTQSSSAIPVVPLYISILYKLMKEKGTHEGCIEQIYRLYNEQLFSNLLSTDETGRIRVDNLEMEEDVQNEILKVWENICTENIFDVSDIKGYKKEFFKLFGFKFDGIDYDADVEVNVKIPSIE